MQLEIVRIIPFEELVEKIRKVPLKQKTAEGENIYVYQNAKIGLRTFMPEEVNPPTFYLLNGQLQKQRELYDLLATQGIDSLNLNGAVEFRTDKGELWTLTPPIIESVFRKIRYHAGEGEIDHIHRVARVSIPLICDGSHRVALARELGKTFTGVYIVGANPEFSYYAHPNGWEQVNFFDNVPLTKDEKKMYRFDNCYALFRDFDVLGCGGPRYTGPRTGNG